MRRPVIVTDLDGTLLNHDDYRWAPAVPALARAQAAGVPIVLNSSKTAAEMIELAAQLRLDGPLVFENGGGICRRPAPDAPWQTTVLGVPRAQLQARLNALRARHGWRFRGFGELDMAEVAALTGLTPAAAALARRRQCSEPLDWQDDEDALAACTSALEAAGLAVTRGGRFVHVSGRHDKGSALEQLLGGTLGQVIALGDAPNDLPMLQRAAVAIVIPRPDGSALAVPGHADVRIAPASGAEGWGRAVDSLLDELGCPRHKEQEHG